MKHTVVFRLALSLVFGASVCVQASTLDDLCPEKPLLLKNPPTPVQDQCQTPWCASFAASSALSYYTRSQVPSLPADLIVSAQDLNRVASGTEGGALKEGLLSLSLSGEATSTILGAVQDQNFQVKTLKGSPFVFDDRSDYKRLVESLQKRTQDYATSNPHYEGKVRLKDHELKTRSFEVKGDAIGHVAKGRAEIVGLDSAAVGPGSMKRQSFPESYPSSLKIPAYNIHISQFLTDEPDGAKAYFQSVMERLREDSPVLISTCMKVLGKDLKMTQLVDSSDTCGPHAMLVVGVKRNSANECVMITQNSWGTGWGEKGYVNIPFSRHIEHIKKSGGPKKALTWIRPATSSKPGNVLSLANGASLEGEIRDGMPSGILEARNYPFPDKSVYTGEVRATPNLAEGSYLLQVHGRGAFKGPGEFWSEGDFEKGRLMDGRARMKLEKSVFEGVVKDGKLYDGTVYEDSGKSRRIVKGFFISF